MISPKGSATSFHGAATTRKTTSTSRSSGRAYFDKGTTVQNETTSAKTILFPALKHKSRLHALSTVFTGVIGQRRQQPGHGPLDLQASTACYSYRYQEGSLVRGPRNPLDRAAEAQPDDPAWNPRQAAAGAMHEQKRANRPCALAREVCGDE